MNTSFPHQHRGRRSPDPSTEYVIAFEARLRRLLRINGYHRDLDDVVSSEKTRLFENLAAKIAAYPNPEVYAAERARCGRATVGYHRNQNAQRGAGAYGNREVDGGDAIDGAGCQLGERDFADDVVDRLAARSFLDAALIGVPADQKEVLLYVGGLGYTVKEAGVELGIARETASRKYHAARKTIGGLPPC